MGVGRGGAALSPIIAGVLLNLGFPLWVVTSTPPAPVLVTGSVILAIRARSRTVPGIEHMA